MDEFNNEELEKIKKLIECAIWKIREELFKPNYLKYDCAQEQEVRENMTQQYGPRYFHNRDLLQEAVKQQEKQHQNNKDKFLKSERYKTWFPTSPKKTPQHITITKQEFEDLCRDIDIFFAETVPYEKTINWFAHRVACCKKALNVAQSMDNIQLKAHISHKLQNLKKDLFSQLKHQDTKHVKLITDVLTPLFDPKQLQSPTQIFDTISNLQQPPEEKSSQRAKM